MFEVEDYIIYGNNGVCKVVDIGPLKLDGIDKEKIFYTLEPVYAQGMLFTPVDNYKVVMRKLISEEEAWELIDDIPNIEILWAENDKLGELKYKESMKKCDCREWIKIIKTLHFKQQERLSQGKKITNTDERYLHTAENHLYGELSLPLNIPKEKMEDLIMSRLEILK